jgi:hypothetical protein
MNTSILKLSQAEMMLANATKPEQTKKVEAVSAAAIAYAKEQGDYEAMVTATRIYVLARRRTTELFMSERNIDVTLEEMGFTRMQWLRRKREYEIEQDALEEYFDECISYGWNPSIAGLLKSAGGGDETSNNRNRIYNLASSMLKTMNDLSRAERQVLLSVTDIFKPAADGERKG